MHRDVVTHALICLANIKGRRLMKDGFGVDFALKCYDRALLIDVDNEDIYYHRGKLYFECGQLNNARNDLKKSTALSSYFIEAKCKYLHLKFDLACNANDKDIMNGVLVEFDDIARKFKDSCVVFSHYAEVLTSAGKYEEAKNKLEITINLDGRDPDLCLQMGKLLLKASCNIDHLYEWCFKALKADCRCIVALEIIGLICLNLCSSDMSFFLLCSSFSQHKHQVKNLLILSMASSKWQECALKLLPNEKNNFLSGLWIFRTYFFRKFAPKYMSMKAKEIIGDVTNFLMYYIYSTEKMERLLSDAKEIMEFSERPG
ncbi:Mitochondrial import receptor subunit TOM70-like protein, partial [Leptotrombidium deliense]